MNPLQRALIEKYGNDNGFEYVVSSQVDGVTLASARHPNRAVVGLEGGVYRVRFQTASLSLLPELRRSFPCTPQTDAFGVATEADLAALLRRAARLSCALPSQVAQDFEVAVSGDLTQLSAGLGGTQVERLVRQRVGQHKFREAMLDYWGGACAVTAVALPQVLRASHAKPWAECESDAERLDVFNGFLLVANLDALFDRFLISFDDSGRLLVSSVLSDEVGACLGLHSGMALRWLSDSHRVYLAWHRLRWRAAAFEKM